MQSKQGDLIMKKRVTFAFLLIVFFLNNSLGFIISNASSNQLTLTEIGQLHTGSRTVDVYVNEDVLYALDLEEGLQIYNISDLTAPIRLGSFHNSYTFSHGLCYNKDLIFIADYEDKLEIVNVTDPTTPHLIGQYQEIDHSVQRIGTTNLHVKGDLVFLASQSEGMELINVEDPTNPVEIGNYYAGRSINVVYSIDNLAFIREVGGNFKILNISDPTSPAEISHCIGVHVGQNFFVMDDLLYIPDTEFGFRIYDITDPSNIIKIGEKQIDGSCMKCVIEDRGTHIYAFVSAEEAGLIILDVTDPANIIELAQYNDDGQSFSIFIQNDIVFVAEFSAGLEILQIEGLNTIEPKVSETSSFRPFFLFFGLVLFLLIRKRKG